MKRIAALLVTLLAAFVLGTACGGGGDEGTASGGEESKQQVRAILEKLIVANQAGDFEGAKPHLDVGNYLLAMDSPEVKRLGSMTPEEFDGHAKSAFNQLQCVGSQTTLTTPAAIRAALAAAQITIHSQTKSAMVVFRGPDSGADSQTMSGEVAFRAKLTLAIGTGWKLQTIDPEF